MTEEKGFARVQVDFLFDIFYSKGTQDVYLSKSVVSHLKISVFQPANEYWNMKISNANR